MKLSARNVLKGRVVALTPGAVNVEVVIEVAPGVQVVSIITKSPARHLGVAAGSRRNTLSFVIRGVSVLLLSLPSLVSSLLPVFVAARPAWFPAVGMSLLDLPRRGGRVGW